MDPFLVLLHSVSTSLSSDELTELKFLCRSRVGKRKLESVLCGLDLFNVLLEQNELDSEHTELLRELLVSLRRQDLLQRLDNFEAGAAGRAPPEERDLRAAFDIICDNVGKDWRRLARHLKVTDTKIDAIEEKYPRNLTEQVRESLRVWKSAKREDATVSHLVRALRACQLNLVADLIEEDQQARENEENASSRGCEGTGSPPSPGTHIPDLHGEQLLATWRRRSRVPEQPRVSSRGRDLSPESWNSGRARSLSSLCC